MSAVVPSELPCHVERQNSEVFWGYPPENVVHFNSFNGAEFMSIFISSYLLVSAIEWGEGDTIERQIP